MAKTNSRITEETKKIVFAVAAIYFTLFGVVIFLANPGEFLTDLLLRGMLVAPVATAFIAAVWASIKTNAYKRLWRLMAIGMFLWLCGEVTAVRYVAKYGSMANIPSPSLVDLFSVAYLPLMLGVILSLGRIRPPFDSEKRQFLTNVSMTALAVFLLCYKFMLAPGWYSSDGLSTVQKLYAIAYPIFDWIIFVSLLLTLYRFKERQVEGWLLFLLTAGGFTLVAVFAFFAAGNERNAYTTWLMMGSAIFITLSAIDEVTNSLIGIHSIKKVKGSSRLLASQQPSPKNLVIPVFVSLVIPVVWVYYAYNGYEGEIPLLGFLSAAILLLLIYRNHLLLSDRALLLSKTLYDNITGLNNHRYFQEALMLIFARANKNKTNKEVSLLVIDIDDFADINKVYGHVYGDKVLATIGSAIKSKMRESDEACRLSSDEFAIILPKTCIAKAVNIEKSVRKHIDKKLREDFPEVNINITMGISNYPALAKDKDELLHTADGALYWAKINGKNRSLVYDPEIVEALSAEERAKRAEKAALIDMVRGLANAVDARDRYTRQHSRRVSALSVKLARHIGLDEETIRRIEAAGELHDVGKIGTPDSILNKPGRLTDEEMDVIKNHPVLSGQIMQSTSLKEIVPLIRAHHERWDGRGYPDGLKGTDIPFEARIMALADTYDAMTTDRPYRKGLTSLQALEEIEKCAGSQFDPELAKSFLEMFYYNKMKEEDMQKEEVTGKPNSMAIIAS